MKTIFIFGENQYLADQTLHGLIEKAGSNLRIIDAESADETEVLEALEAQSLFSTGNEKVLIKNPTSNKKIADRLVDSLEGDNIDVELYIFESRIDKRSKLFKLLKNKADVTECRQLGEAQLIDWIVNCVEKKGGDIDRGIAKLLADRLNGDQMKLSNELEKLVAYDKRITLESIELLVQATPDDNIFELLNLVATGNKSKALKKYQELLSAQVDPHYVLVMLAWQMSNMLAIKSAGSSSDKEIAALTGINPYTISKTRQIIGKFSSAELNKMAKLVLDTDKQVKTSSINVEQSVELLISKL